MTKLSNKTLEKIKSTPQLYADVATAMGVRPSSLEVLLRKNGKRLTEYQVLKVISDYTGKNPDELIEEYTEVDDTKVETVSE